ncbi:hypothetical protein C9E88_011160 [Acinetobacter cumulans]|uniref:A1S_1983 family putative colistin resistance protein n=1 Tax=Acinetobacter TaxID=469 RepID=UPI000D11784D|nr:MULTISPECIES: hypothetical protein [Acinetobacter]QCO21999.1 hypothetical protein C9E88_011160 [Acinetobacter cumulans]RFS34564.1 hypothetical protein DYI81_03430 [Acinetobacter sp. SWAC5]
MLLKTDKKIIKNFRLAIILGYFCTPMAFAEAIQCIPATTSLKKVCSEAFSTQREKLDNLYLTASLVTDAPLSIIQDTQYIWQNRLQQCKSIDCYKQQFELRADDLNIFVSLNQSLTQHYLKFEHGTFAQPFTQLKVHQLSKDRIKIEGLSYRNPNNRAETQIIPFLAYTTPDQKNDILDNEHDCKYQFSYSKAILSVQSKQQGCERFVGIYRLYD